MTVAPTTAASTTAGVITGAQQSLAGDQQTFLKLLTTQLKNQDPLSPLDTNQFTQQLVQMTGVQQQIVANQLLQQLVNNQSGIKDPVSLIGRSVTADTDQAVLAGGKTGWTYSLAGPATTVGLQVFDDMNRPVWSSTTGAMDKGEHALSWNGKDLRGNQLSDGGTYTLKVMATDANGKAVDAHLYQRGVPASVEQDAGQTFLNLGGVKVPVSAVTSVGAGT